MRELKPQQDDTQKDPWYFKLGPVRVTRDISIMDILTLVGVLVVFVRTYDALEHTQRDHEKRIVAIEKREADAAKILEERFVRFDDRLNNIEALLYQLIGRQSALHNEGSSLAPVKRNRVEQR